jgi:hypothetical protein
MRGPPPFHRAATVARAWSRLAAEHRPAAPALTCRRSSVWRKSRPSVGAKEAPDWRAHRGRSFLHQVQIPIGHQNWRPSANHSQSRPNRFLQLNNHSASDSSAAVKANIRHPLRPEVHAIGFDPRFLTGSATYRRTRQILPLQDRVPGFLGSGLPTDLYVITRVKPSFLIRVLTSLSNPGTQEPLLKISTMTCENFGSWVCAGLRNNPGTTQELDLVTSDPIDHLKIGFLG